MSVRRRGRWFASGCTALALTVSGCAAGTGTAATDPAEPSPTMTGALSASPEPVESETPEESPSTDESTSPVPEATQEPDPVRGIRGKLLTEDDVPGFNEQFAWREKTTRMREGRAPFGTCHRFAMTSIGAMKVTVRTFEPARRSPGSTASHLVATFGDEMTARRAYEVLESWREQCADQLSRYDSSEVGKLEPVPVDGDAVGSWYLLVYGPADDADSAYFDAQGLTMAGRTISVVQMRLVGQDYNYARGEQPMVAAVQNAATAIG